MGVALMFDQGQLADAPIGLTQLQAKLVGQPHQPLARPVEKLRVGREHHRLRLHRRVDHDASEVGRLQRLGSGRHRQALLQKRLQLLLSHPLAPARQRGAIKNQSVLEKLLAAEVLEVRVLYPALAQRLVGQIVAVLEDRKSRHQPRRQRRTAGFVGVNRTQLLPQEPPIDRPREPHQRMIEIDDLIEPRAKQILRAGLSPLLRSHVRPLSRSQREDGITPADSRESQNRFCKETTRRRPKTCKYHYFAGDNQSHRSTPCGFFTDDYFTYRSGYLYFSSSAP